MNIVSKKMTAKEMMIDAINQKIGKFNKTDILELCPEIKSRKVEKALKELCDEKILQLRRKVVQRFI